MGGQVIYIWSEIERAGDYLVQLIHSSRTRIEAVEREMIDHMASVSPEGQKNLTAARRIVGALERRLEILNSYLYKGAQADLYSAYKLLSSPLVLPNDCVNKLISEADIPPIPPAEIKPMLEQLLNRISLQRKQRVF